MTLHWSDYESPGRPGPGSQTPPLPFEPPLPESVLAAARRTVAAWALDPADCVALIDLLDLWPDP